MSAARSTQGIAYVTWKVPYAFGVGKDDPITAAPADSWFIVLEKNPVGWWWVIDAKGKVVIMDSKYLESVE